MNQKDKEKEIIIQRVKKTQKRSNLAVERAILVEVQRKRLEKLFKSLQQMKKCKKKSNSFYINDT